MLISPNFSGHPTVQEWSMTELFDRNVFWQLDPRFFGVAINTLDRKRIFTIYAVNGMIQFELDESDWANPSERVIRGYLHHMAGPIYQRRVQS